MKRTGSVVLLSLVMMVMSGCEKKEDTLLDRGKARAIISTYLENPRYDVNISVDIERDTPLVADVVGYYQNKTVSVKYGKTFISMAPAISPNIDYYLEFPPGNELFVKSAMESLKAAKFTPVLAQREDLGAITAFQAIHGSFRVRSASEGECYIEDKNGTSLSTFKLKHNSIDMFRIPDNSGFGLMNKGEHELVCSFSNVNGLSTDDLLVARFSIASYDTPKYKDGLKDMICALNAKKILNAHFTSKEDNALDVVYYRDGSVLQSNVFKCDKDGEYTVKAIVTDKNGIKAESPEVTIKVTFIPEEFWGDLDIDEL